MLVQIVEYKCKGNIKYNSAWILYRSTIGGVAIAKFNSAGAMYAETVFHKESGKLQGCINITSQEVILT